MRGRLLSTATLSQNKLAARCQPQSATNLIQIKEHSRWANTVNTSQRKTSLTSKRRTTMLTRREALRGTGAGVMAAALIAAVAATPALAEAKPEAMASLARKRVDLVAPPFVHAHEQVASVGPQIIEFKLTVKEQPVVIDGDGTVLQAMTYNGSIPAPMMVVHQGDYVELTLVNPESNEMPHNIDFHAATGGLGGGALTHVSPGEQVVLRFKADRTGTFVYHCAPDGMIPWHVVSGMSGTIMVLPRDGLRDHEGKPLTYDTVFYVGESDFYVPRDEAGNFKKFDSIGESFAETLEVMRGLVPTHVVFNGKAGALTGENALKAKVGDRVLIVHSQANRDTRPHLIGGHGDYVWEQGKFANAPARDLETWFIRGGSAGAAFYTFKQPGVYAYVNHNLIEAAELGATAHFVVDGDWNDDLMTQVSAPAPIANF
jgi:nitrite reductase (NO-forming)